jgi:hypothetical protein
VAKTTSGLTFILLVAAARAATAQRPATSYGPSCAARGKSLPLVAFSLRPVTLLNLLVESGIKEPLAVLVRDSVSWDGLWRRITQVPTGERLPNPAPAVDFQRDMVVVYALGESMPMGRFRPVLRDAALRGDTVCVTVEVRQAASYGITNTGSDSPVALAVTRNVGAPLQVIRRDVLARPARRRTK